MKQFCAWLMLLLWPSALLASEQYPSIRAMGLCYNNGAYTTAQADTVGRRYDIFVLGQDAFKGGDPSIYVNLINAIDSANDTTSSDKLIFVYNSTDISFNITDTTDGAIVLSGVNRAGAGERDSLLGYLGAAITVNPNGWENVTVTSGFPHNMFFHTESTWTSGSFSYTRDAWTTTNDQTKIRSQMFTWNGGRNRYWPNFTDADTRVAQIRFNKEALSAHLNSTTVYADGIWWDNCAFSMSHEHRTTDNPQSKTHEFPDSVTHVLKATGTGHYKPSVDDPTDSVTGVRYWWVDGQIKMLDESDDTLGNSANWHPTGRKVQQIINIGEQWLNPNDNNGTYSYSDDYVWRDTLQNTNDFCDYVYYEHTPNVARGGFVMRPGPTDGQTAIDSSDWQGGINPYRFWKQDSTGMVNSVNTIYHPGYPYQAVYKPYGVSNRLYSDLCLYYLIRNDSTYWKTHGYNTQWNVEGGTGAGGTSDSVYHIDAYTYNFANTFPLTTPPYPYATSVDAPQCSTWVNTHYGAHKDLETAVGKAGADNWIVWRRDFANGNFVVVRPLHQNDATGTATPAFNLSPSGATSYQQIQADGTLGSSVTTTTLRAGEGKMFTPAAGATNEPPAVQLSVLNSRDSLCIDTSYGNVLSFNAFDNDGTIDSVRIYAKNAANADTIIYQSDATFFGFVAFVAKDAQASNFFRIFAKDNDGDTTTLSTGTVKTVDCSVSPPASQGRKVGALK